MISQSYHLFPCLALHVVGHGSTAAPHDSDAEEDVQRRAGDGGQGRREGRGKVGGGGGVADKAKAQEELSLKASAKADVPHLVETKTEGGGEQEVCALIIKFITPGTYDAETFLA